MAESVMQQANLNPEWLGITDRQFLKTASGEMMRIAGRVTARLKFGGRDYLHEFLVVPKFKLGVLLGGDFCYDWDVKISYPDKAFTIQDAEPTRMYGLLPRRGHLLAAADTVFAPRSRRMLAVKWSGELPSWWAPGRTIEVEPDARISERHGLATARSWGVMEDDGTMMVQMTNPHPQSVLLQRNVVIGAAVLPNVKYGASVQLLNPGESNEGRTRGKYTAGNWSMWAEGMSTENGQVLPPGVDMGDPSTPAPEGSDGSEMQGAPAGTGTIPRPALGERRFENLSKTETEAERLNASRIKRSSVSTSPSTKNR